MRQGRLCPACLEASSGPRTEGLLDNNQRGRELRSRFVHETSVQGCRRAKRPLDYH